MSGQIEVYVNGYAEKVVVIRASGMWTIEIQNLRGAALRFSDGEVERSSPFPCNKKKTLSVARRLSMDLDIPAYERTPSGHLLIMKHVATGATP